MLALPDRGALRDSPGQAVLSDFEYRFFVVSLRPIDESNRQTVGALDGEIVCDNEFLLEYKLR
jgi:hypothetical protein